MVIIYVSSTSNYTLWIKKIKNRVALNPKRPGKFCPGHIAKIIGRNLPNHSK